MAEKDKTGPAETTAVEDLMQEHGLLNRVLLIYEECMARIGAGTLPHPRFVHYSARIVRLFVEDYHERTEEQYVFPRFRQWGRRVEMVDELQRQHDVGRALTDQILVLSDTDSLTGDSSRVLVRALGDFVRMYRVHEAWEDTVIFPEFRETLSSTEYARLGELFEREEREKLGERGFERYLAMVDDLEKGLGIHDLARVTPHVDVGG